jgi:hypothetical protein
VPNSFEENVCENANTRAQGGDHLLVLAHLRRRWSLSGREGLGSSLPPAELARRDSALFGEVKRLFSTTPEVGKETEANAVTEVTGRSTGRSTGRCTGRCTGRGHYGPARPVSAARASGARARV